MQASEGKDLAAQLKMIYEEIWMFWDILGRIMVVKSEINYY